MLSRVLFVECSLVDGFEKSLLTECLGEDIVSFEQRKSYNEYFVKIKEKYVDVSYEMLDKLSGPFLLEMGSTFITIKN